MVSKVLFLLVLVRWIFNFNTQAQKGEFALDTIQLNKLDTSGFCAEFGKIKKLLPGFEFQCLVALSQYPELKNVNIKFVIAKTEVPLMASPTFWSLFRRKSKRTFQIQISEKSMDFLNPILLKNLSLNAQIGVLGHELAHISDMKSFSFWRFVGHGIKYTLSKPYGDRFEFGTDRIAIEHGFGLPLYCWSAEVRRKLNSTAFFRKQENNSKRERYMNPNTILNQMADLKIYSALNKKS